MMNPRGATKPNLVGNTGLIHHRHHRPGRQQWARAVIRGMTPAGYIRRMHHAMNPARSHIFHTVLNRQSPPIGNLDDVVLSMH